MARQPLHPDFEGRVRASFERQQLMATLGAVLTSIQPGEVRIQLPFREQFSQQHGFLHAGIITAVVDSACGYAALTLMPPKAGVMSVEFKVNLLAPAAGPTFRAVGRVLRSGRTITVCAGELWSTDEQIHDGGKLVAVMQATMMAVSRPGISD